MKQKKADLFILHSNHYFLLVVLFFGIFNSPLKAQGNSSDLELGKEGNEILSQARKAIKKGNESLKIDGLSVNYSVNRQVKITRNDNKPSVSQDDTGERQLNLSLPDKVKFSETTGDVNSSSIYNFVLNGNQLETESYGISDGQRMEYQIKGQETPTEEQKKQQLSGKKKETFFMIFPILLDSADFPSLEFKYIGKAESDGEKADVIETAFDEETKIRLFFDEQTHLLKMMIRSIKSSQFEIEEKRFYSNYKETDGLTIASKINIESKQLRKFANVEMFEEQTVKSVKINPTFKPNFFEVKKN